MAVVMNDNCREDCRDDCHDNVKHPYSCCDYGYTQQTVVVITRHKSLNFLWSSARPLTFQTPNNENIMVTTVEMILLLLQILRSP